MACIYLVTAFSTWSFMKKMIFSAALALSALSVFPVFSAEFNQEKASDDMLSVAFTVHRSVAGGPELKASEAIVGLGGIQGNSSIPISDHKIEAYIAKASRPDCKSAVELTPGEVKSGISVLVGKSASRIGAIDVSVDLRGLDQMRTIETSSGCAGSKMKVQMPVVSTAGISSNSLWLPEDGSMVMVGEADIRVDGKKVHYRIEARRSRE